MSTIFRKPNQVIQPWKFGHPETKATCLWLFNLPKFYGQSMGETMTITTTTDKLLKELEIEEAKVIIFNSWFENRSEELYTTDEGHQIEQDFINAKPNIIKAKIQARLTAFEEIELSLKDRRNINKVLIETNKSIQKLKNAVGK